MLSRLGRYRKAIVALVGAVVLIVGAAFGETSEVYQAVVSAATFLGVYAVPNE